MDSAPKYSIAGKQLFTTQNEFNVYLPDEASKHFFSEIIQIINNIDNFNYMSKMDFLLKISFTNLSQEQISKVNSFLNNQKVAESCIPKNQTVNHIFNWNDMTNPTIKKTLSTKLLDQMQASVENLIHVAPLSSGTDIGAYRAVGKDLCKIIWKQKYDEVQNVLPNTLNKLSNDKANIISEKFCDFVTENANKNNYYFNKPCDEDQANSYFKGVYTSLMHNRSFNDPDMKSVPLKKLFIFCFYPYFLYEFILNNVASKELNSLNKQPRFYFLDRTAVLGSYMFLFYTISTIEESMEASLQKDFQKSLQIMAKINDELFSREKLSDYLTYGFNNLHESTVRSQDLSKTVQDENHKLNSSLNNLIKAKMQNTLLNSKERKTKIFLYIWVTLLLISVIYSIILVFVLSKPDLFYLSSILTMLIIFVSWGIQIINKKY